MFVMKHLFPDGLLLHENGPICLERVRHTIEDAMRSVPGTTLQMRRQAFMKKPQELVEAERLSAVARTFLVRLRKARCEERKLRARWNAVRHKALFAMGEFKAGMPKVLKIGAYSGSNRAEWLKGFQTFCETKFHNSGETAAVQKARYARWISLQISDELEGKFAPLWPFSLTLRKRAELKKVKCSGGGESVVNESLQALPIAAVVLIHQAFLLQYAGRDEEELSTWKRVSVLFIPKGSCVCRLPTSDPYRG